MRIPRVALFRFGLAGCGGPSAAGPAVRLAASDTILINSHWPTALPIHALAAEGRTIVGAPIRFERVNGAALPVISDGAVTCAKSGDISVRAVLETLTTRVVVRCQLVEYVRLQGMQFILGDSQLSQPRALTAAAYSADGRTVSKVTRRWIPTRHLSAGLLPGPPSLWSPRRERLRTRARRCKNADAARE